METGQNFRAFPQDISWSTLFYTLMAIIVIAGAFLLQAWSTNFALTILLSIAAILFIESIILSILHHPRTWRNTGWILLLLLLAALLIGAFML